jgi:hypothetical protein
MLRTSGPRRALTLFFLAALALAGSPVRGGDGVAEPDPTDGLARELVGKRGSVEKLSGELELAKGAEREALRALAQQKADVERRLKALEHEREELDRTIAEREAAAAAREAGRKALTPLVARHLDALAAYVKGALPFRTAERVQALEELKRELEAGRTSPEQALSRLWSALEDELRLTRDTGLYRQQLAVDGSPQLVDVAKLGMVLLYVRTLDGRFGFAAPDEKGAWRAVLLTDPAAVARVRHLFEALDGHARQGHFALPHPLAATAGER